MTHQLAGTIAVTTLRLASDTELAVTVFLMHRQTMGFHARDYDNNIQRWRIVSVLLMIVGFLAALGVSMVSNFQEGPQLVTHDVGAFTFFIGIVIYFWGQIIMSYGFRPRMVSVHLINFRVVLNLLITAILIFRMFCLPIK
ncbi:hypothetical protein COOONC_27754, partial [Cooperia oncophora]